MSKIISKAPGRICLFGDHQDYLDLPVIACSIDRMMQLEAIENGCNFFEVIFSDLNQKIEIPLEFDLQNIEKGDHLKAALKVLRRKKIVPKRGYKLIISSNIPINSGLSSSTALIIVWINFLFKAFGKKSISPKEIAQIAYEVEVIEQKSSGGKMDHFTISLGNTIYLDTKTDKVTSYKKLDLELVVGVSGLVKDTLGSLNHLKLNAVKAIKQVQKKIPNFEIDNPQENTTSEILNLTDDDLKPYLYAAIKNFSITRAAKKEFEKKPLNINLIGKLMNEHHNILKTYLKITPPLINRMIENANRSGALGSKIVGSGGGGCIVAIADKNNKEKIINSIIKTGAKDAFSVNISNGTTIKNLI